MGRWNKMVNMEPAEILEVNQKEFQLYTTKMSIKKCNAQGRYVTKTGKIKKYSSIHICRSVYIPVKIVNALKLLDGEMIEVAIRRKKEKVPRDTDVRELEEP
jgi:hypothetical protein